MVVRSRSTRDFITGYYFIPGSGIRGFTTERPWLNNASYVSAIPLGTYRATVAPMSRANVDAILLLGVPGRTEIFMHGGRDVRNSTGCPLVGKQRIGNQDKLGGGPAARQQLVDYVGQVRAQDSAAGENTTVKVKILPQLIDWTTMTQHFSLFGEVRHLFTADVEPRRDRN